jgi:hypothetical protein
MTELSKKIGQMDFDGLRTDLVPPVQARGGVITGGEQAATYKRGTVLGKADGSTKLAVLGSAEGLVPDCILCDDVQVEAGADTAISVYTAGCFDPDKVTVADGYTMTDSDLDELRKRGIVFKAAAV